MSDSKSESTRLCTPEGLPYKFAMPPCHGAALLHKLQAVTVPVAGSDSR